MSLDQRFSSVRRESRSDERSRRFVISNPTRGPRQYNFKRNYVAPKRGGRGYGDRRGGSTTRFRRGGPPRGGRNRGRVGRRPQKRILTTEELDAELDKYANLDAELDNYMNENENEEKVEDVDEEKNVKEEEEEENNE